MVKEVNKLIVFENKNAVITQASFGKLLPQLIRRTLYNDE